METDQSPGPAPCEVKPADSGGLAPWKKLAQEEVAKRIKVIDGKPLRVRLREEWKHLEKDALEQLEKAVIAACTDAAAYDEAEPVALRQNAADFAEVGPRIAKALGEVAQALRDHGDLLDQVASLATVGFRDDGSLWVLDKPALPNGDQGADVAADADASRASQPRGRTQANRDLWDDPIVRSELVLDFLDRIAAATRDVSKRVDAAPGRGLLLLPAEYLYRHGCLDYGRKVRGKKVRGRHAMLAFQLELFFRTASLGELRLTGAMPGGGNPARELTADLVDATFPPEADSPATATWVSSTVQDILRSNPDVTVTSWSS